MQVMAGIVGGSRLTSLRNGICLVGYMPHTSDEMFHSIIFHAACMDADQPVLEIKMCCDMSDPCYVPGLPITWGCTDLTDLGSRDLPKNYDRR